LVSWTQQIRSISTGLPPPRHTGESRYPWRNVPAEEPKRPELAAPASAVEAMKRFMAGRRTIRGVDIKALIEYGRT